MYELNKVAYIHYYDSAICAAVFILRTAGMISAPVSRSSLKPDYGSYHTTE
jgi:hypothetical protein